MPNNTHNNTPTEGNPKKYCKKIETSHCNDYQFDFNDDSTEIEIKIHYTTPESIKDKNTLIIEGVSNGEYLEIIVKGKTFAFEHILLGWDDEENSLIEKEVINNTIMIKTYIPEGIPLEKLKWKTSSGKTREFIIQEMF